MIVEFPIDVSSDIVHAASLWHDGQWSSFYLLASTGKIHSWDQVSGLEMELNKIFRDHAKDGIEMETELRELQDIVADLANNMPEQD